MNRHLKSVLELSGAGLLFAPRVHYPGYCEWSFFPDNNRRSRDTARRGIAAPRGESATADRDDHDGDHDGDTGSSATGGHLLN